MLVVNYNSIYNNGFIAISAGVFATVSYLYIFIIVFLVQQLFTDECILPYLFRDGILQLSSKGGVKFGARKLGRYCRVWYCCFGEDIA